MNSPRFRSNRTREKYQFQNRIEAMDREKKMTTRNAKPERLQLTYNLSKYFWWFEIGMNIYARICIQFIVTPYFGGGELPEIYYFFLIYSFINFNWYCSRRWNRELRRVSLFMWIIIFRSGLFVWKLLFSLSACLFVRSHLFSRMPANFWTTLAPISTVYRYTFYNSPTASLDWRALEKNSNVSKPSGFFCNYVLLPFFFSISNAFARHRLRFMNAFPNATTKSEVHCFRNCEIKKL